MRSVFGPCLALLSVLTMSGCGHIRGNTPPREDRYLGQKPPGSTPERFAPGLVSTAYWEVGGTFTPDMNEYYFISEDVEAKKMNFVLYKYEDGEWQKSIISPRVGQPFISPNGKIMHLGKRYMEREEEDWSERKDLGGEFQNYRIMRLTASSQGTYYFDEVGNDGDGKIRYSRLVDGTREAPKIASDEINTGTWLAHPFIAPDESYLLWDGKRNDGYGDSDIYISFRQNDGSWGAAINLGDEINTDAWEASASVTPDGKYIFFNRNMGSKDYEDVDIFWVDAQIIEKLRTKNKNHETTASAYFDQRPPGLIPEVFAPGIISINGRYEGAITFSPELDEVYFGAKHNDAETQIYFSRLEGGKWTPVKKADFTDGEVDREIHPSVSPDGKRIYFAGISSDLTYNKIWYADRLANGWSKARELKSPANDDQVFYPNQSVDGDLYYFSLSKSQTYRASDDTNGFSIIEPAGIEFGVHAFIAPSQDYMVLNARHKEDENRNDNEIYASFKREDGSWTSPVNLGDEINSSANDKVPMISPDGKYLFFGRDEKDEKSNIYWVSTEVIERLRPKP